MANLKAPSVKMDLISGGRSFQRQALRYSTERWTVFWRIWGVATWEHHRPWWPSDNDHSPFLVLRKVLVRSPLLLLAPLGGGGGIPPSFFNSWGDGPGGGVVCPFQALVRFLLWFE